ncbi:PREDICTED: squamosa promoter-binding-like protein 6 [Ipomoea nil]|uniref:squamosa promoter-binding-like protein 6 n=1 Tax=Ipomoea nil TaxID=35883 RepID=UPI0009010034|nr:PREDICTED: squamosa promoter-binding-like protein 6 [Ipomoea nil]
MDFMSYAFEGSSGGGVELAAENGRLVVNERNLKSSLFSHHQIDDNESPNHHEAAEFMEFCLPPPPVVCVDPAMVLSSSSSHPPVTAVFGRIPAAPDMEVEEQACNWLPRYHTSSFNLRSEQTDDQSLFKGNFESAAAAIPVNNKRLVDCQKAMKSGQNSSKEKLLGDLSSSMEAATGEASSATLVRRARITNNLSSSLQHPPICQVHGCFRDLSSSKDYYRRHRVCNDHSKTTKVIVDGIEQRFCQQCSRFHLLSEFDDDKRSCRKSLAGHNERRRKPQFDTHHGPRFFDMMTTLQTEPYLLPELLPVNYFCQDLENTSNCRSTKMEEKHISFSKLGVQKKSKKLPEIPAAAANILTSDWDLSNNNPSAAGITTPLRCFTSNQLCSGVLEMEGYDAVDDGNMMSVYYEAEMDENSESAENGTTIDLEQLSTHLQRVEHQRNLSAPQTKVQESNLFYCFTSG